jgi:phosphoserine phosphatase RsbU/P
MATPRMQESAFQTPRPPIAGLDYFGSTQPASGPHCDYFECFPADGGSLGIALAEVSAGDEDSLRLSIALRGILRSQPISAHTSLKALMRLIDRAFVEISPDRSYSSLFLGVYDPASARLHYVNAGHEPPFILRPGARPFQTVFLEPGGPVLGMLRQSRFREGALTLHPGDLLVAYSDGLYDVRNPMGESWGWPRFLRAVEDNANRTVRDLVGSVHEASSNFATGEPPGDDATLFAARIQQSISETPHWEVEWSTAPAAA